MKCPYCNYEIDIGSRINGDRVLCPTCGAMLTVRFIPVIKKEEDDGDST